MTNGYTTRRGEIGYNTRGKMDCLWFRGFSQAGVLY